MFFTSAKLTTVRRLGIKLFSALSAWLLAGAAARADTWSLWANVNLTSPQLGGAGGRLANDGTNIFFSTYLDGVYRATLADKNFSGMPLTGFPLWDANTNTNGFAVSAVAATPQGTVVIAGSQVQVATNSILFNPPGSSTNTLPVFYWWDETNQLWHASAISGKLYPYTGNVGNFSLAPDGSLWACSGFYPYAYRSTNGGKNFTAFDINARVPTNYFPLPLTTSQFTFGEIFSVCAGWNNEVVIGTETGGFLHTTNNGATWRSLDPNYTNTNSTNPLGRTGDARVAGIDHYGNFLCRNFLMSVSPARSNWFGVPFIGWRPRDNLVFNASGGFTNGLAPITVVTPPSGMTFGFANQNYLLQGGVQRAFNGKNWSQFNQGTGLNFPFSTNLPNYTNLLGQGNCITMVSNVVFIGVGSQIYSFDSVVIPNRPPVARPLNQNLWENSPTNFTLAARDADGDALNFSILAPPLHGNLTGPPPDLTYTPSNNFIGLDGFTFTADDSKATSAPVVVNFYVNKPTNTLSSIALTSPADGTVFIAPATITLIAAASDPDGITQVFFYYSSFANGITNVTAAPYTTTLTNVAAGDYTFSARAFDAKGARTWSAPVRVTVLPFIPQLNIRRTDSENVTVTWPLDTDDFYLETAPDISGPWMLSPQAQLYLPTGQSATIPKVDQQFFRLMHPQ